MIKKLKFMPYTQARVHTSPFRIWLQSYETCVAVLDGDWLHINGLYSMTTRKHIKAFCKEYCGFDDFNLIKTLVRGNLDFNIKTGEVVSAA